MSRDQDCADRLASRLNRPFKKALSQLAENTGGALGRPPRAGPLHGRPYEEPEDEDLEEEPSRFARARAARQAWYASQYPHRAHARKRSRKRGSGHA
jgi:hypothetical protein